MSPIAARSPGPQWAAGLRSLLPRGSFPAVASRGANALLAFASTVLIARLLGPGPYGDYALAVTVLYFLAIGAQLGVDNLTTRDLGVYVHGRDWPHAFAFMRWSTRTVLAASAAAYALASAALALNPMRWSPQEALACQVVLLGLPFIALLRLARARLQAFDRTALGLFLELPLWNLLLLAGGLVLAFAPPLRTGAWMAALHAAAFAAAFLAAHVAVRRGLPPRPPRLEPVRPAWLRSGLSFTALAAAGFLLTQGDVILIGTLLPPGQTGHFSVAARSAGLTLIVLQPLQQVVAPRIAKAWSRGDRAEASRLARRCAQLSLVAGVAMVVFFWLFGGVFLRLFGEGYGDALWALRWLALAQLLSVAFGPGSMVLQMINGERAILAVQLAVLAAGWPLTAYAALHHGIAGAALAKVAVLGCAGAAAYVVARRRGVDILPFSRGPRAATARP